MKCFSVLLLVAFVALAQSKSITDEHKAELGKFKTECIADSHVDEAVLKKAKHDGDFADDEKLKDFFVCFFKKMTIFDQDGKLNKKNLKECLEKKFEEDVATKIFDACGKEEGGVKETAIAMAKCYHEHAPHVKHE